VSKGVLVVCLLLLTQSLAAGTGPAEPFDLDWPQWRGPHRDAVSRETGLVADWGEQGPRVRWRIEGGAGFSSVSVSEERLYTLWDEGGSQILVCLEAATGRQLWRREVGSSFEHPYGDGPRATPLVRDGLVYAIGTSGRILAADQHTGETAWQRDLVKDFDAELPSYGYASSPLVVDDKLIIEAGGGGPAFVALDRKTGGIIWTAGDDPPAYSSPIEIEVGGVSQVVFWSAHGLHAMASQNGRLLWRYAWETFCPVTGDPLNTGTPVFIPPDRIFLSSSSGAAVIHVVPDGGEFHVEEVWRSEMFRADVNTALWVDGYIYGFDRGTLESVDAATGEVRWKARGFQRGSLIAADGRLIVLGERGKLALVVATPEAYVEQSAARVLEGRNWTTPTLADGRLYLRNSEEIVCIDLRSP
jgi:outer membrane protein assembly factor BamB